MRGERGAICGGSKPPPYNVQTDARGKRLPCVRLVQIKTIDNCFYQTVSPKARSIGSEAMLNARDDYETATGKRGTAIAVEGLF